MTLTDLPTNISPKLDEAHLAMLEHCGGARLKQYSDRQTLVQAGDSDHKFFVVKSGHLEVLDDSDPPNTITALGPGEFTGEEGDLIGGPSTVTIVARGDCEVYEVSPEGVREIINRFPELGDLILQTFIARRNFLQETKNFSGVRVVGSRFSRDTHRIRDFLTKNRILFTWLDLETDPQVQGILRQFGVAEADTPVVDLGRKRLLRNPSNRELAEALGMRRPMEHVVYDMAIVGAGPAGLAAAVYAASEGLNTIVLERAGHGGQAGRSMRIENYLGFPTGITGGELAERAVLQAGKFGASLPVATYVTGLKFENAYPVLDVDGGDKVMARCLLIACGADYRRLDAEGCTKFEGSGVYYAATPSEVTLCRGAEVVVVGGGNSAGQAVIYLSGIAHKVYLVIRGDSLYENMSSYLAQRIEKTPNVEVLFYTTVRRMSGDRSLSSVELINSKNGEVRVVKTPALFSFIGATPRTDWLPSEIETDDKHFIKTGSDVAQSPHWNSRRQPYLLETCHRGVFAAGDVRSGSVKRVATAVGEGAMAVQFVHAYFREM